MRAVDDDNRVEIVTLAVYCAKCGGAISIECEHDPDWNQPLNSKGFTCPHCEKVNLFAFPGKSFTVTKGARSVQRGALMKRNTYIRDEKGIAEALAELRRVLAEPPTPEDLAWQNDLPELPEDGTTIVEFLSKPKARGSSTKHSRGRKRPSQTSRKRGVVRCP
jgi:hypothetical protein